MDEGEAEVLGDAVADKDAEAVAVGEGVSAPQKVECGGEYVYLGQGRQREMSVKPSAFE